jgi:hypothetical protein
MVAPTDEALQCAECHSKYGLLEEIEGVYIPGRDTAPWIDRIGFALALITLLGVIGHGMLRILFHLKDR